jgi:Na+/glutamate symporter
MKRPINIFAKNIFLILSGVLLVLTLFNYLDYLKVLEQIEQDNIPIDVMFGGWTVAVSYIIMAFYELIVRNRYFKLLIRVFLFLLFVGIILKNVIPVDDFDAGVENTSVFSGFITLILFLIYGLKKIYDKRRMPAANNV